MIVSSSPTHAVKTFDHMDDHSSGVHSLCPRRRPWRAKFTIIFLLPLVGTECSLDVQKSCGIFLDVVSPLLQMGVGPRHN